MEMNKGLKNEFSILEKKHLDLIKSGPDTNYSTYKPDLQSSRGFGDCLGNMKRQDAINTKIPYSMHSKKHYFHVSYRTSFFFFFLKKSTLGKQTQTINAAILNDPAAVYQAGGLPALTELQAQARALKARLVREFWKYFLLHL